MSGARIETDKGSPVPVLRCRWRGRPREAGSGRQTFPARRYEPQPALLRRDRRRGQGRGCQRPGGRGGDWRQFFQNGPVAEMVYAPRLSTSAMKVAGPWSFQEAPVLSWEVYGAGIEVRVLAGPPRSLKSTACQYASADAAGRKPPGPFGGGRGTSPPRRPGRRWRPAEAVGRRGDEPRRREDAPAVLSLGASAGTATRLRAASGRMSSTGQRVRAEP